jgi:hypothetical protein
MATRRKSLFEDEIEQSLLEELTASDQSICSDIDDSSGTDDLTVDEVNGSDLVIMKMTMCGLLLRPARLVL